MNRPVITLMTLPTPAIPCAPSSPQQQRGFVDVEPPVGTGMEMELEVL